MTEPTGEDEQGTGVPAAVAAVRAIVDNAPALGLVWSLRPATVSTDSIDESNIQAVLDGDTVVLGMVSLIGPQLENDRVMVATVPPAGLFIIGTVHYDPWHEPSLATGWSNVGDPFADAGYRRTPDGHVELAGLIQFTGTTSAPVTMFTLPEGYRPDHTKVFTTSSNPGSGVTPTVRSIQVDTDGNVILTNFTGPANPGVVSLDGIYFPVKLVGL